jgi:Protein of unknown function/AsmA-like C-terminal region
MANHERQSTTSRKRDHVAFPRRRGAPVASQRGGRSAGDRNSGTYRQQLARYGRLIRRVAIFSGVVGGVLMVAFLGLWWRLASGPIQLDVFTPWLVSAIEENFGSHERVSVGGTQIERTGNGGAAVRIRDIVVRDQDGAIVARAPKAEVHVSALSLLTGHMRVASLNLVGAELKVRIERDGQVTVFAGADKHPLATATVPMVARASVIGGQGLERSSEPSLSPITPAAAAPRTAQAAPAAPPLPVATPKQTSDVLAAVLSWIDGIGETGLDGHELRELGLKEGTLTVTDERSGKDWALENIQLSLERPHGGGVAVKLSSESPDRPWQLVASVRPVRNGSRNVEIEARHLPANDIVRAFHFAEGDLQANVPLSASVRGEIGADGVPRGFAGRVVAERGFIGDATDRDGRIDIDQAESTFTWTAADRRLSVPFQIISAGNRITLVAQVEAPEQSGGDWLFKVSGGTVVLVTPGDRAASLTLDRIALTGNFNPTKHQFVVEQGDVGNRDVDVVMSGNADNSSGEWRLNAGFAGKRMSADTLKRLWPVFVVPKVRDWFNEHLVSGAVDHVTIGVNAPIDTLRAEGPPVPDRGLSIEATATNCVLRPVDGLPALNDADLAVHIVGRNAQIAVGKATATMSSGKKLVLSNGLFEVPDTAPHEPPARVRFKLDGPVPAAIELLSMDRLRDVSQTPFDAASTRGNMSAQVSLAMPLKPDLPPGSTNYSIVVDATNFSAEHMIMGQRLDAPALHVVATPQGFQFKNDVKIAGAPANLEYHQANGDTAADIRISGMLDATGRNNLGLDPTNAISGSVPIHLSGRFATTADREGRFSVEADLTSVQINNFLPGWAKPAGKPSRITFTLNTKPQSTRIDDLVIEGAGDGVKGAAEFNGSGELQSASFPGYGFSDGDKVSLKADRAQDGTLRVTMRGELYDGRAFIKGLTGGGSNPSEANKHPPVDVDLDIKVGAVLGFNGEALSNVDLKMSRRAGELRALGLNAKIGREGMLSGELHGQSDGHEAVYLRTSDAGALFRATDVYPRMSGGQMAIMMDAPSANNPTQQGTVNVVNFSIHDEAELQRAASQNGQQTQALGNNLQFSSMQVYFTRSPGRVVLRDGVARGPVLGGTIDGTIDYTRDMVDLRGTLVPFYVANNFFGWIPVVGPILGGDKEGIFGFTYKVSGRPGNPVLNVNILSGLAPGVLRKIFEYPASTDSGIDTSH